MDESKALVYMKLFREDWDRNSKTENAKALDVAIKALEEMQKIKTLGDCYIIPKNGVWEVNGIDIHKAIEKQTPKKINSSCVDGKIIGGYCPTCNGTVRIEDTFLTRAKGQCCTWCGQKLEW